jgi:hypothetical protein
VKLVDDDVLSVTEIHWSLEKYRVPTQEYAPVT